MSTLDRAAARPLAGLRIAILKRVSSTVQVGNESAQEQESRLITRVTSLGGEAVIYDENQDGRGASGRDLAKRNIAREALDALDPSHLATPNTIHGLAAWDVKRLTRDEWGVDAGVIAKRLARRHAVLVTIDRLYDPRDNSDRLFFRLEGALSGYDITNIRNTFWRGLFGRAAREPFFLTTPPLGYIARVDEVLALGTADGRPRIKRTPAKNPEEADIMAALARWLDKCQTMSEVGAQITAAYGERLRARTTTHRRYRGWGRDQVRRLLTNPIYWGEWQFGRTSDDGKGTRENDLWDIDHRRERVTTDFTHYIPNLAYWTKAQAQHWLAKFNGLPKTGAPRHRYRQSTPHTTAHSHPLLGLLVCVGCGRPLVGWGKQGYGCRAKGFHVCPSPGVISERNALRALRAYLPEVLAQVAAIGQDLHQTAVTVESAQRDNSEAQRLRSELRLERERLEVLTEDLYGPTARPRPQPVRAQMLTRLDQIGHRIEILQTDLEAAELHAVQARAASVAVELLARDPLRVFDSLPLPQQVAIYRLLLTEVVLRPHGRGANRACTVIGARLLVGGHEISAPPAWGWWTNLTLLLAA